MKDIESVLAADSLPGRVKCQRIFDLLHVQPRLGADVAARYLAETEDWLGARYAAKYLALIPGMAEEKTRAAEHLRGTQALTPAASWLVPWLSDDLLDMRLLHAVPGLGGGQSHSVRQPGIRRNSLLFLVRQLLRLQHQIPDLTTANTNTVDHL